MNMFKSNGGFTLVELIVVIAILAILAGIAVPAYSGYIKKAEQAADVQVLSTINTAAQGLAAGQGATVAKIEVTSAGAATVTLATGAPTGAAVSSADVAELVPGLTAASFTTGFNGATWTVADGWDINYTTGSGT